MALSKTQTGNMNHDFLAVGMNYHDGLMIKSNIFLGVLGVHPLAQKHFVKILRIRGPKTHDKDRHSRSQQQEAGQTGRQTGKESATDRETDRQGNATDR